MYTYVIEVQWDAHVDIRIIMGKEDDALNLSDGYVSLAQEPQSLLQILKVRISISISID